MEVQGPFVQGMVVPWTKLGSHDQPAFKDELTGAKLMTPL
jgi:hypothetical protein